MLSSSCCGIAIIVCVYISYSSALLLCYFSRIGQGLGHKIGARNVPHT